MASCLCTKNAPEQAAEDREQQTEPPRESQHDQNQHDDDIEAGNNNSNRDDHGDDHEDRDGTKQGPTESVTPASQPDTPYELAPLEPFPPFSPTAVLHPSVPKLKLTYRTGNIFDAPSFALLIHACNTQGFWGAGIAAEFKKRYPRAHEHYRELCKNGNSAGPVSPGDCQLIGLVDGRPLHYIGCLYTSAKIGKRKDDPDVIVANTVRAMESLLEVVREQEERGFNVKIVRMCKVNEGKFNVPWSKTAKALESIVLREGWVTQIQVWTDPNFAAPASEDVDRRESI